MPPDPKAVSPDKTFRAELDQMHLLLEKLKTGNWRIPPHGDPIWKQVNEMNKALEVIAKNH